MKAIVLSLALGLASINPAVAQEPTFGFTAAGLEAECLAHSQEARSFCLGYIDGVMSGMFLATWMLANDIMADPDDPNFIYDMLALYRNTIKICPPDDITREKQAAAFIAYVATNPEVKEFFAESIVLDAMRVAYPCVEGQ
jgi:hypothetical protein